MVGFGMLGRNGMVRQERSGLVWRCIDGVVWQERQTIMEKKEYKFVTPGLWGNLSADEAMAERVDFSLYGGGLYSDMSNNPSFLRGGLDGLSRAIKAEMHDAAVVVEYDTEAD